MSDQGPQTANENEDSLAAELVLGLLEGQARARALERARTDAAFQADVEAWEQRLAPLIDEVASVAPPEQVWGRIATSIGPGATVVPWAGRERRIDRIGFWRAATVLSTAAAACLAIVAIRPAHKAPASAPAGRPGLLAATLATSGGKILFVATVDRAHDGVTVVPVGAIDGGGRFPELWIIPAGAAKPKPVGMIQNARPLTLVSSAMSDAGAKAVLAVSLEPEGGSTTGAPTGPVIATGALSAS